MHRAALTCGLAVLLLAGGASAPLKAQQKPPPNVAPVDTTTLASKPPRAFSDGAMNWHGWPFFESEFNPRTGRREVDFLFWLYRSKTGKGYRELHVNPFFFDYLRDEETERLEWSVLWPLVHHERRGEQTSTRVAPLYWSADSPQGGYSLFLPLWYSDWSPKHRRTVTLPWVVYGREGERTMFHAWPLYGHHDLQGGGTRHFTLGHAFWLDTGREDAGSFAAPFPLIYRDWSKQHDTTVLAPLLYASHWTPQERWRLLAPFFYSSEQHAGTPQELTRFWTIPYSHTGTANSDRHDVLFPLFTREDSHDGRRSSTAIRPLFWHERSPGQSWSLAPPFYYWEDRADGHHKLWTIPYAHTETPTRTRHDVLFPLFTRASAKDGSSSETAFRPLFWHERTPEQDYSLALPLWYWERTRGSARLWTLPYLYNHTPAGVRHDVLFPLFTREYSHDGKRSSAALRPLFWYDRTPERTWSLGFPFWWSYETDDSSRLWTPLFQYNRDEKSARTDVLFPLFTYEQSRDEQTTKYAVRPFFWHEDTPEASWTLTFPLFYHRRDKTQDDSLTFGLPFWYQRTRGDEQTTMVPPFWWYFEDAQSTEWHVWPFVSHYEREDYTEWSSLWPLAALGWGKDRSHARFLPLFAHHREGDLEFDTILPPIYWYYRKGGEFLELGLPLYWYAGDNDAGTGTGGIFPLYWHDHTPTTRFDTFAPLFWRYRSPETDVDFLPPLYGSFRDDATTTSFYSPLVWRQTNDESKEYSTVAFPLYWRHRSPSSEFDVIPPLVWRFEDHARETSSLTLFPFYWRGRDPKGGYDIAPPFYGHTQDGSRESGFLSPFYWYSQDEEADDHTRVFFPLYWRHRSPKREHDVVPPLYWRFQDERQTTEILAPLYWHFEDRAKQTAMTTILPLWGHSQEGDQHTSFYSPLVWRWNNDAKQESSTLVLPFYYRHRSPTERADVVAPFYWSFEDEAQKSTSLTLFPFYFRGRSEQREHDVVPPFWWRFRDGSRSTHMLLPFFFDSQDSEQKTGTTSVLGFYWSFRRPDSTLRTVLPLYWDYTEGDSRSIHLWPLFGYSQEGEYSEVSTLWPLFRYGSGAGKTHLGLLWPLVHYESKGDDFDFRVFGWWYRNAREGKRRDHYLMPLWKYSSEGESSDLWVLWPLFIYGQDAETTEYRFLYKFFHHRSGPSSGLTELNPFFSYEWQGDDEGMFQIFGGLYYRRKQRGVWESGGLWGLL